MKKREYQMAPHRLREAIKFARHSWDQPTERATVRENFLKVCTCRTPALGGEVYASATEEKIFYHTCKSRACPSCGNRRTQLWQREQWRALPDIPFVGVVLTMPDVFWPIFGTHRHLQHDLPALGAAVLKQWARNRWGVQQYIIVVQHTFGGRLNYNPHLHIMVSAGGLDRAQSHWVESLKFDREEIMDLWRFSVCSYLLKSHRSGMLNSLPHSSEFGATISSQMQRRWNIHITQQMSKQHFLRYAGRYIRRLPISQKRILEVSETEVVYQLKDTRTKSLITRSSSPAEFIALLAQHIPDRYRHSMRYFGLLAPRTKQCTSGAVFNLLHQELQGRPRRLPWRQSLLRDFHHDPLIDGRGQPMHWARRVKPTPGQPSHRAGF